MRLSLHSSPHTCSPSSCLPPPLFFFWFYLYNPTYIFTPHWDLTHLWIHLLCFVHFCGLSGLSGRLLSAFFPRLPLAGLVLVQRVQNDAYGFMILIHILYVDRTTFCLRDEAGSCTHTLTHTSPHLRGAIKVDRIE